MLSLCLSNPTTTTNAPKNRPNKKEFDQSAFSGRLTIAQRFIAGKAMGFATKSVKRTTEKSCYAVRCHSAVRYTDCVLISLSSQQ